MAISRSFKFFIKSLPSFVSSSDLQMSGCSVFSESSLTNNSSYNFSPDLNPILIISISPLGLFSSFYLLPLSLIIFVAKS